MAVACSLLRRFQFALLLLVLAHQPQAGDAIVVFNELQYQPRSGGDAVDWVELHNLMAIDMDLSGWGLTNRIRYTFPSGTILPGGGYLVVAGDPAALPAATGATHVLGPFEGRLANEGERLELRNQNGRLMDEVRYGIEGRWPVAPTGSGVTLAKRVPGLGSPEPESWSHSRQIGGKPGAANLPSVLPTLPGIRFNELSSPRARPFWIELANDSDPTATLAGLIFRHSRQHTVDRVLPAGEGVHPGGFRVLVQEVLGMAPEAGEVWLDDLRVTESPDTAGTRDLLQNGDFENGSASWRFLGNHRRSEVIPDPDRPGNHILRLLASGPTEHMHNHLETTLVNNTPIMNGRTYRISFRTRGAAGEGHEPFRCGAGPADPAVDGC